MSSNIKVFDHREFDRHEEVVFFDKPEFGLKAIVAIHNTDRGPALGGLRMYPYDSDESALSDVLRLSKSMTYKSAVSGLALGGGKSVIIGNPKTDKSKTLFDAFSVCLNTLNGRYIVAEDSGTTVKDLQMIATRSAHVSGTSERITKDGRVVDGDPSPATAYGVLMGMKAAVFKRLNRDDLVGIKVAVQGVGAVGRHLVGHLYEEGADIVVSDAHQERVDAVVRDYGVRSVAPEDIYQQAVDIFSPCALGAVLDANTSAALKAKIIAGAANNQLAEDQCLDVLQKQGVLYVPDFVINAGGVIDIASYRAGMSYELGFREVAKIYDTTLNILNAAAAEGLSTLAIAMRLAERNFQYAAAHS